MTHQITFFTITFKFLLLLASNFCQQQSLTRHTFAMNFIPAAWVLCPLLKKNVKNWTLSDSYNFYSITLSFAQRGPPNIFYWYKKFDSFLFIINGPTDEVKISRGRIPGAQFWPTFALALLINLELQNWYHFVHLNKLVTTPLRKWE